MGRSGSVLSIAFVIALAGCWEEETVEVEKGPRPVIAMKVGTTDFLGERVFTGRARAAQEAELSFRVAGQLSERRVNVGDIVEQGELVANLDPGPFLADVSRINFDLAAATASYEATNEQFGRIMKLVESGTYSEARGDTARGQRDSAASRVESLKSSLERAELDLSYTELKAPYSGRVVAVFAENFEDVNAREPVVRLLDVSKIEIVIDIPETLIALVPLVEELAVTFDAFPDFELTGFVEEIGSEASLTTRTYPVTIVMDQPEGVVILPGMSGQARASKVKEPDRAIGLVVPTGAIRPLDAGSEQLSVWIVDDASKTVSLRPVEVGRVLSVGMEVTDGLSAGEWIVTAGTFSLTEGQEVSLPAGPTGAN